MSSNGYISLPVVTDSETLVQSALSNIASNLPGWTPREGNLEVLLLEEFASMVAEVATEASVVPDSIFEYFGTLIGITPLAGVNAQVLAQWTLLTPVSSSSGYVIPAGTAAGLFYQGNSYVFALAADLTIPYGSTSASAIMTAVDVGAAYNVWEFSNFSLGSTYLSMLSPDPNVSNILITATPLTSGSLNSGVDAETDSAYKNRLANELTLLAPRPITASDYATISRNVSGITRAMAIDSFNPFTNTLSLSDSTMAAATNYTPIGTGSGGVTPTIAAASNALTMTAVAVPSTTPSITCAANATTVTVGSSLSIFPTTSVPIFALVTDATNGNEIIAITNQTSTTWTLAAATKYAHSGSATVEILQGVQFPVQANLTTNSTYWQAAAAVKCGTDTTALVTPYIVSLATYSDGSKMINSSCRKFSSVFFDYTNGQFTKTINANVAAINTSSTNYLAPNNTSSVYNHSLYPYITNLSVYVLYANATATKTHVITYPSIAQTPFDFTSTIGTDAISNPLSNYNFIPDANLNSYGFGSYPGSSWSMINNTTWISSLGSNGLTALPGYGFQLTGTGALANPITAVSPVFNLTADTQTNFTATVNVNALNVAGGLSNLQLKVLDVAATVSAGSNQYLTAASGSVINPTSAAPNQVLTVNFSITANTGKDLQLVVIFGAGLNINNNTNVIVGHAGIFYQTFTPSQILQNLEIENGYSWAPGGFYSVDSYSSARNVAVIPVDSNGLPLTVSAEDSLADYLESYREANFSVEVCQPNYVPVDVSWSAICFPGYVPSAVTSTVNAALYNFLSPANWAGGSSTPPYWDSLQSTIRVFDLASVIAQVTGISNVTSVTVNYTGLTSNTGDYVMPGIAPLPVLNSISGSAYPSGATGI